MGPFLSNISCKVFLTGSVEMIHARGIFLRESFCREGKGREEASERTAMISCHIILDLTSIGEIPAFPVNKNENEKKSKILLTV